MIANGRREFIGSGGVRSSTGLVLVLVMFIGKVAGSQAFLYQYQQALGGVQDMDINGLPKGESRFLQFDTPAPVTSGEVDNTTPVPAPSSDDPDVFVTSAPSDADAASVPGTAQPIAAGDFITQPPTPAPATDSPAVQPSAIASTDRPAAAPTIAPAASVSTSEPSGLVSTGASPSTPPTPSPVTSSTEAPAGPTVTEGSSAPTTGVAPTPSTLAPGTAPPFAPSTCADGITAGVSDGVVCCKQECGVCGDVGCSSIPGTNGASDCCPSTIIAEAGGTFCGEAPCVMEGFTPSPVNPAFVGTAAPVVFSQCSNGLSGYQDRDVCCSLNCGQCGGDGCGSIPGTGGASFCCSSVIRTAGVTCGEPPCIIEDYTPSPVIVGGGTRAPSSDSLCSNGIAGYQDGAACCEANCGQCGGEGCGSIPGTGGQASCCSSTIEAQNVSCLASGSAPCVIDGYTPAPVSPDYGTAAPVQDSWCSNGMPGYQDLDVCCLLQCGQCGGAGCGSIPGTPGSAACCSNTIRESGKICDWSNSSALAPCVIGDWTPSPVNPAFVGTASPVLPSTCSNGIAGYQNGAACCAEICGQCGGVGCGTIPGTGGSPNCCASSVLMSNVSCGAGVEAPCVIPDYTPAPAGVPGTAAPYAPSNCTNGLPGYQDAEICCAENCGQCGGEGCGSLPGTGGSEYCCSTTIRNNGTDCSITGEAPCIIGDWVYTPSPHLAATYAPAAPSNCSNGLAGYQKDDVCCKEVCGLVCGESGCGAVNASNCCATNIRASGVYCEDGAEAPCIIVETDAPTAAPTPVASNPDNLVENTSDAVSMRMLSSGGLLLLMPLVGSFAALLGTSVFGLSLSSVGGLVKP